MLPRSLRQRGTNFSHVFRKLGRREILAQTHVLAKQIKFTIDLERYAAISVECGGKTIEREYNSTRTIPERLRGCFFGDDEF